MSAQIAIAVMFLLSCCIDAKAWQRLTSKAASKRLGKANLDVRMTVQHSQDALASDGALYLDSEADNTAQDNLRLSLTADALAQLTERGIVNPARYFMGKQLEVHGAVMQLDGRAVLPITHADQIVELR
ncbi:hypothetical protein HR45_15740 [Shewanella mangrovi]|uniref:Uncharacterized protein n=1 Tax=Shewanella mangrovi TaxID=1515746 RepID=A0A094JVV6_9GAMM|nr:hypothetical protein [Shewanella mangrovi]KFZ36581.1 hypothetical protein HR45_15740 [Shewanella mangrovi]